ncbi:glycosyltransferase family 4 protein [Rahnella inusitata]|uniref:Glycosyltransferase n=1 Tax=Rahnella inusitata TaxID=58169 RepID=A0ABX9P2S6_9GAMM|nr:glycosyltransferase family 4 protein [Rahnella inusitata]RJT14887.1 glycosyltransferase [Rahnella inusitata]
MKIAHVQVIPKLSGVQQITLDILSGLNDIQNPIEKIVICGELIENEFVEAFVKEGIEIISIPSIKRSIGFHDIKCFIDLYKLFKKNKFDIVHTNSTKPGIIARIAAKCAGIKKIIHTVHGIAFHAHTHILIRIFYYILENIATLFGDINITVNKKYTKYYPLVKSVVIYNGVDFEKLNPINTDKNGEIHFAFLGRLDEQKNPLEFIQAVDIVLKKYTGEKKLRFSLAGDGDLRNDCELMISKLALAEYLQMPGWVKNKDNFFNDVDVLCQPSKWEAFGLVFVEAAYYSIPSIATSVEGIPEVVLDGHTGILYQCGAEQLANCMIKYIESPALIAQHGENAKGYVTENFSKEKMLNEYSAVYFK